MKPQVSDKFRQSISDLVAQPELEAMEVDYHVSPERNLRLGSVLGDIMHFHFQMRLLAGGSFTQYAVRLGYDGPQKEPVPVLVQIPDLHRAKESYEQLLESLDKSNLKFDKVDAQVGRDIFVDRLSEFLTVRSATFSAQAGVKLTIVNSNRHGDTVLYAKGYFVSTGMALGVSTPAQGQLSGTYSFGIMDSGKARFESTLWSCPAVVKLNLP
jgi:hypothetical protein